MYYQHLQTSTQKSEIRYVDTHIMKTRHLPFMDISQSWTIGNLASEVQERAIQLCTVHVKAIKKTNIGFLGFPENFKIDMFWSFMFVDTLPILGKYREFPKRVIFFSDQFQVL